MILINLIQDTIAGFEAPVHRALTEPILLAGVPRSVAIINGTLAAAIGLGLRLWLVGLVLWAVGHMAAARAARRDPFFVEVVRRHVRYPTHFGAWPNNLNGARQRALLSMTDLWRRCLSSQDDSETQATEKGLGVG